MESVYRWLRSLAGYLLFWAVLENLLPGKSYEKYVRLFAGVILILLVFQPLVNIVDLEGIAARDYEERLFSYDVGELEKELLGVEEKRTALLIENYEQAVEEDVRQMAVDAGFSVLSCDVEIEADEGADEFGSVTAVTLRIAGADGNPDDGNANLRKTLSPEAEQLRQKIHSYYRLEEGNVKIWMVEGER
ncbi:MAG: stage III sporulation protein AF [Clostridiales bacterium]|nr:stage III sporulation protein AF [Clostridiales bacterium]